jgi:hypothetical protein
MKLVMEQEVSLKGRIIELIASTLRPFIAEHGARTLRPVLEAISVPVSTAFAQSVQYYYSTLSARYQIGEFNTPAKRKSAIRAIHKKVDYYWNSESLLYFPSRTISILYYSNPQTEEHFPPGAYSLDDLKHDVIDAVRDMSFRALFYFINIAENETTGRISATLAETTRQYLADVKVMIKKTLTKILKSIMNNHISQLWTPGLQLAQPVQNAIDVIPTAGLSHLFHVNCLLREVIQDVVDRSITASLDSYQFECDNVVDQAQTDMMLPSEEELKERKSNMEKSTNPLALRGKNSNSS